MEVAKLGRDVLDSAALAQEFDVPEPLMAEFIARFAPARVAPGQWAERADILLFVHIPKTAGMSVGRSLQHAFDVFRGVDWAQVQPSFRAATREAIYLRSQGRARQVIMGHYGWPELQIWRNHQLPMKCATFLRDPLARMISNYNYNCSPTHPANDSFRARFPTLFSYAEALPYDVQITQALGLIDSFETVLRKLVEHYTFLGLTEFLPQSLAHLSRSHGLAEMNEHRENIGAKKASQEPPAELRALVESRSYNDLRLHALLTRLYQA